MSQYNRGRRLEWEIRDIFKKAGYTVTRAAGSKGPWDLVAVKPGKKVWMVVLAQCKLGEAGTPDPAGNLTKECE